MDDSLEVGRFYRHETLGLVVAIRFEEGRWHIGSTAVGERNIALDGEGRYNGRGFEEIAFEEAEKEYRACDTLGNLDHLLKR